MTQEEKAKAYDKAIERAKSLIGDTIIEESGQHIAEVIFPELKESEDERIRKALIVWLKNSEGQTLPIDRYNAALAWLEKQGEQKPNPCDGCVNRKGCINCENGELRETEQNPADAFIKRADEFISTFFHPDDTELINTVLNKFHEHMKLK